MAKILLIEDDLLLQKIYFQKFVDSGFSVILAGNGREGIDKAILQQPDFILLDLQMPGIDGLTALQYLKAHDATKNIPVAILSAIAKEQTEADPAHDPSILKGAVAYWRKDENIPSKIVENVKQFLEGKKSNA